MFPQGFFGTRADLMMDLVIVAFIPILLSLFPAQSSISGSLTN